MHFFIMFVVLINLMINIDYVIVLECWNTALRNHPTERENGLTADLHFRHADVPDVR